MKDWRKQYDYRGWKHHLHQSRNRRGWIAVAYSPDEYMYMSLWQYGKGARQKAIEQMKGFIDAREAKIIGNQ